MVVRPSFLQCVSTKLPYGVIDVASVGAMMFWAAEEKGLFSIICYDTFAKQFADYIAYLYSNLDLFYESD